MQTCMAILKASDLETVRRQQVKNILTKQAAGKTLTAREERTLAEAATDQPAGAENFVRTYDELAGRLGVSRKAIQNWQKRFPSEYPQPRADGRHEVAAWLKFMTDRHLAGADPDGHPDDRPVTVSDWKAREIKLKCTKLEIENAKTAGELIEAAEVEAGTTALIGGFRQALNNFIPRLAQKLDGVTDYHERVEIIEGEVNVVLRTLQRCDFLESPLSAVNPVNPVTQVKKKAPKRQPKQKATAKRRKSQ